MKNHPGHSPRIDQPSIQAIQQYLDSLKARGFSPKSISTYRDALRCFNRFLVDRQRNRIQDVTPSDLEAYRLVLVERKLAPTSLELYLRTVRQLFSYLEGQLMIFLNPTVGLVIPKPSRKLQPVPTEKEMVRLLEQPDISSPIGIRDRAILETAYATGARRAELIGLKVADVNLSHGVVRVLGKGNKERLLPLGKQAIYWLERYLSEAHPKLVVSGLEEVPALWLDHRGKKLAYHAIERLVKEYAAAAGIITPIAPHSLRRACATHMLRNGAHPVQLQMLLGHASLRHLSQYLQLTISHPCAKPTGTMKTMVELLADFLERGRSLCISAQTLRVTRYHVAAFLRWLHSTHGIQGADRLLLSHLEGWQNHLASQLTWQGLPLKPRSINRQIVSVLEYLRYLQTHGLIAASLLQGLAYVKEPQLLPTSVLNHGQMRSFLAGIRTRDPEAYRDRAMLEVLYSAGLRAGELLGLNVGDVDLSDATAIVLGKGNKQRVVPIGRTALRVLESYLRGVRPFLTCHPSEQALFLDRAGKRMAYHAFWRRVHYYISHAKLPDNVSPHTFRRSCTTELIRGGANIYHVKELLGHESLDTLKHYAKLNILDLKETHRKCHPREREET